MEKGAIHGVFDVPLSLGAAHSLQLSAHPASDAAERKGGTPGQRWQRLFEEGAGLIPHVPVCGVTLLPGGAEYDFAHQAVAVSHAQRLLEQAPHLLPMRGGSAGRRGEGELCGAAVEHDVEPAGAWAAGQSTAAA